MHEWELDLEEAAHRPLESDQIASGPPEGTRSAKEAAHRQLELDQNASWPPEGTRSAKEAPACEMNGLHNANLPNGEGESSGVALISGRILTENWVELLLEDRADSGHRLVVMWHTLSNALKRWRLSPRVHIHDSSSEGGLAAPTIIVDDGRGFLPLGTQMCDRNLLAMVMVHSGATAADRLCNMNQMDRCSIPLRALEASLSHRQLDTVTFYLTSSLNAVDHWLRRVSGSHEPAEEELDSGCDLSNITKDLQDAVGLILAYSRKLRWNDTSSQNSQYCHQLTFMLNKYLIEMITKAVAAADDPALTADASDALHCLQSCLHELYLQLKTFMDLKTAEKQRQAAGEAAPRCDPSRDLASDFFVRWDRLDRAQVVIDGLVKNAVPLMVEYLLQRKAPISVVEVQQLGLSEVRERLQRADWDGACFLVLQMGLEVRLCFEDILWETGVMGIRNFLLTQLNERGMLSAELRSVRERVERLEAIYSSHNFHAFRMRRVARPMLALDAASGPPEGNLTHLLLAAKAPPLTQVPAHRGSEALASREAEDERAEAASWTSEASFDAEDDDEEVRRERAASLSSGQRSAYHRFRLFALRHVSEAAVTRMCIDQAPERNLRPFLNWPGGLLPLTRYLLDYSDTARLMALMTPEMAALTLELEPRLPPQQWDLLLTFMASEFDLFEARAAAQPLTRLLRYLHSGPLATALRRGADLTAFTLGRLVSAGAAVALHGVLTVIPPPAEEEEGTPEKRLPRWAEAALALARGGPNGRAGPLCWELCRVLLASGTSDLPAVLAAALLSARPLSEALQDLGRAPDVDLGTLHGVTSPELASTAVCDLYALLSGCVALNVGRVFGWQKGCLLRDCDLSAAPPLVLRPSRPHFGEPRLIERFGNQERLGFRFYLLHRRPLFAYLSLSLASARHSIASARFEQKRREAGAWAHQLAIENATDGPLVSACLAFVTLTLRADARRLRSHLMCLRVLRKWCKATQPAGMAPAAAAVAVNNAMRAYVDLLCTFCLTSGRHGDSEAVGSSHCLELDRLVTDYESAVLWRHQQRARDGQGFAELLLTWTEVLNFAQLHRVNLPRGLLEHFATGGDWLGLLATAQLFPFGKADLRCVLSHFSDKGLRDHLSRVIDKALPLHPLMDLQRPASSPQEPQARPAALPLAKRDPRRALYTTVGVDIRRAVASTSPSFRTSPEKSASQAPSGVASSIESRESDSVQTAYLSSDEEFHYVKLRAAVEALTTDSLFELLLTVRSPRTLLAYSMTLSHPLLAILAICTASDLRGASERPVHRVSYFCGFLIASLPYKKKQFYLDTWDGRLIVDWDLERASELIQETLHRHAFRELEDATFVFLPRNPLHAYLAVVRVVLEFRNVERLEAGLLHFREVSKAWLDTVSSVQHVSFAEGGSEPDEELLTCNVIGGTIAWVCAEILREQSARVLLAFVEGLAFPGLARLFECERKEPFPLEGLSRLLKVALECSLPVDATNLLLTGKAGLAQSCSDFALQLAGQKRFRDARRVLDAGSPTAELEVVRRDVLRAEEREVARQRGRFQPALRSALERVMAAGKAATRTVRTSSFAALSDLRGPREEDGSGNVADLLFRPSVSIAWRPSEEANTEGPWRAEVERLLDAGRVERAYRVLKEAGPDLYNEDLVLLLYGIRLACRSVAVEDLPEGLLWAMTQRRVRPSFGAHSGEPALNRLGPPLASGTPKKSAPAPLMSPAAVLQALPLCVTFGRQVGEQIFMMHRVAEAVDAPYELVLRQPPLSVLCKILAGTIVDKVTIADFFVRARQPPENGLCHFLFRVILMLHRHELAKATAEGTSSSGAPNANPARDSIDLQVELPDEVEAELALLVRSFSAKMPLATALEPDTLLKVAQRPAVLGELFLDNLRRYLERNSGREKEHALLVEVLVLANDCMELAGSTEGIADALRLAVQLTRVLKAGDHFRLLVRLLTGMRRYGEMNYIFTILFDNDKFEQLLSKDAKTNDRLKIALIEYLKRHRAKDSQSWEMVYVRFRMGREWAELNEALANSIMRQVARNRSSGDKRASVMEQASRTFLCAATEYRELRCQRRAKRCFRKAQLCALQMRSKDMCLIEASNTDLLAWMCKHAEFYDAFVVSESIGLSPRPWPKVLWERVVVQGDAKFLDRFVAFLGMEQSLLRELAASLRRWCSAEKSQSPHKRQQYVQHLRLLLEACDNRPLVLELCREFGIAPAQLKVTAQ